MTKTRPYFLIAGIAVCLAQIWIPTYYLTGDGPCHVYKHGLFTTYGPAKNGISFSNFSLFSATFQPTGVRVDYVLLWCYYESWLEKGHFHKLYNK